jgi:hypothetical protein
MMHHINALRVAPSRAADIAIRGNGRRAWRGKKEALRLITAFFEQDMHLMLVFHSFGGGGHAHRMGQRDNGADNRQRLVAFAQSFKEAAVDLDLVEGNARR